MLDGGKIKKENKINSEALLTLCFFHDLTLASPASFSSLRKVHMLVYTTWNANDGTVSVRVRDNKTKYGTYQLNEKGVKKCSGLTASLDQESHMKHGDKLLIAQDFQDGAPYEIVYELKMPPGSRLRMEDDDADDATEYAQDDASIASANTDGSSTIAVERESLRMMAMEKQKSPSHVKAIPKLIESTSFWWDEDGSMGRESATTNSASNSTARSKIASRIARLRVAANGGKLSSRKGWADGRGDRSVSSLPAMEMRLMENSSLAGSTLASIDDSTIDSLSLSSMSYGTGNWSAKDQGGSGGSIISAKSAPLQGRYMLIKGGRFFKNEEEKRRKRELNRKYSQISRRNNLRRHSTLSNHSLSVVDGKVIVEPINL